MGERKLAPVQALKAVASASREAIETMVETADESMRGSATALDQLAVFAEYLEATRLFERWRGS